jgi:hypothetical protein
MNTDVYNKTYINALAATLSEVQFHPYVVDSSLTKTLVLNSTSQTSQWSLGMDMENLTLPLITKDETGMIHKEIRELESVIGGGLNIRDNLMVASGIWATSGAAVLTELTAYNKSEVDTIIPVNITAIPSPYWIALKVNWSGSILSTSGRNTANVIQLSGGSAYVITFTTHPRGVDAIVLISANEVGCFYRNQTATSIIVYCRSFSSGSALAANGYFSVLIVA